MKMALFQYFTLYLVVYDVFFALCASVKRNDDTIKNILDRNNTFDEDVAPLDYWWKSTMNPYQEGNTARVQNIEEEIINDIKRMDSKEKRRIFDDLKKQKKTKFFESDNLSPLNIVELKAVQRSIKTPNTVLPTIRNKRTLNFLLFAVARAMGYALIPRNPDVEMMAIQLSPCKGAIPRPPPCAPPPPSTPPPPPPSSPLPPPTIPPNQVDTNTVRYPYRPSQEIPLLQFAPLPPGVTVPYPPLLQWPCGPTTPAPPLNPCSPPTKAPSPCAAPPPPPSSKPPCNKSSKTTPPSSTQFCSPQPPPSCSSPIPKTPPPPPLCSPPPCAPSQKLCLQPASPNHHPSPSSPLPKQPPNHPKSSSKPPITLEYDHPVKIQIFNNGKKFLPASGSVYSGNPSHSINTPEKLEEYEKIDEERREEDENEYLDSSTNIFRDNEESANKENYDDEDDEIKIGLLSSSRDEDANDDEKKSIRSERFNDGRMVSHPHRQRKSNPNNSNFIEGNTKGHDYYTFGRFAENPKKGLLKRVIKIRKPITRQVDEYGNEYTFARGTVHEIQKRDLQDFDFIRKYKESQGDATEDEHFRDESPPGRTTTSIKKIEVKKFLLNKSEDDPEEYHEKNERSHDDKPQKVEHVPEPRQQQQEEHEEEGGGDDDKANYRQFEPPEYEERAEIEKALQGEIAREEVEEEEELSPRIVNHDFPPPTTGKGVQYVTKTITKYVGGSGGKETVRVVPIYKVVHVPPPLPPRPPPVKRIIHHHHHRIPVYPKIIVRTGPTVKRRPAIIAGLTHPGNVLLVTIRERNG